MSEIRTYKNCTCGRMVVRIQNSETPTMWRNGDRYTYPERDTANDRWGVFRCDRCHTLVHKLFKGAL